jgi:hypothetical protein
MTRSRDEALFFPDAAAIESALGSIEKPVLIGIATSPALNEDLALAFLKRHDLPQAALEALAKNGRALKSRKVKTHLVAHPKTPRHVSLPIMRHMYTFELMQVTLTPGVAADVKLAIEDVLVNRISTLAAGERLTLAKRSSGRVAAALLQDSDHCIVEAGLNNPFLVEALVVKALLHPKSSELLAPCVCRHRKWSTRKDVQAAALRNEFTPLAHAIRFAEPYSLAALQDAFRQSSLPEKIQMYLLEMAEKRAARHH